MFKITLPNVNYLCDAQNLAESKNDAQNDAQNISIENMLIDLIINNPTITRKEMAVTIDKSKPTIERIIKKSKRIKYVGSSRSGHWEIVEDEKLINS